MALRSLTVGQGASVVRHFVRQIPAQSCGAARFDRVKRFKSTRDLPYFQDPERLRRLLNPKEANYTKDGFEFERLKPMHGLGDFQTPHPGAYPDLPRDHDDISAEEDWANSAESEDELRQLEYKYTIPNYETENFTFDSEHGILQEARDERSFYENVIVPKSQNQSFRKISQQLLTTSDNERGDSDYMTSKDSKEWSYVERLAPISSITHQEFDYKEHPSGFIPPNPDNRTNSGLEYFVGRTKYCMLPVYTRYERIQDVVETTVGKCEGNVYKLKDDLKDFLYERYEQEFPSQVAELYGKIKFRGDFEQDFKEFLLNKGF